ncbi:Right handed beta helix domain-containing protein [Cladophialophora immunda]|nr:Right handed beta helix domain-containing protein [Cladophialophora immunda]
MAALVPHLSGKAMCVFVWVCAWFAYATTAGDWYGGAIRVSAGESIQAAINTAHPGQLILVGAGTYAEQLTVTTDGLQLVGTGAILVPPNSYVQNTCSGLAGPDTEAGICITGQDIELADFVVEHRKVLSVGRPVQGVLVTGFEVQGFPGLNIAVVGGDDVQVKGNSLYDGAKYGCLTVGSKNSHIDANSVGSTGDELFIGICMDDMSDVQVTKNNIAGYSVGLCIQTDGAYVYANDVTNACYGAFVDPGTTGAQVISNHISDGNPVCATVPEGALLGITTLGAFSTQIQANLVEGMTTKGANGSAVGIAILNDPVTGLVSADNVVTGNVLRDNDVDIFVETPGQGNVVEGNQCSTPAELCG